MKLEPAEIQWGVVEHPQYADASIKQLDVHSTLIHLVEKINELQKITERESGGNSKGV